MARRSGLGKRLQQILDEQADKPAGSWERTLLGGTTPEVPEFEGWETASTKTDTTGDDTLSRFHRVLAEVNIPISIFSPVYLAKVDNDGATHGGSASSRVAAYVFSHEDGYPATIDMVLETYDLYKDRPTVNLENRIKSDVEGYIYVKWQNYRAATPYISRTPPVTLGEFIEFKGSASIGKAIGEIIGEGRATASEYQRVSGDFAATLIY